MLVLVELVVGLLRSQASKHTDIEIVVVIDDVGVCVVEDVVFPVPDVRAGTEHIQTEKGNPVDPILCGVGAVSTIMHDAESYSGHGGSQ